MSSKACDAAVPESSGTRPARLIRSHGRSTVLALLVLVLIFLTLERGKNYGMDSGQVDPSWRYRVFGIPIVLSHLFYGRLYDYVGYKKLEVLFEPATISIDDVVVASKSVADVGSAGLFYILNDDKGIVDFTRLAFLLYGTRTASLYYMYFTVLTTSCLLFMISYFVDRQKLALLALFALALYEVMPAFVARRPGISILDLHTFGILSLPAALHILLSAADRNPLRPVHVVTTTLQALILVFLCHARFSNVNQIVMIVLAYPIVRYLFEQSTRAESENSPRLRLLAAFGVKPLVPLLILVVTVGLLPLYQRHAYNPGYFAGHMLLRHPLYHSLLIGMQWNPRLRDRYGLGYGDLGAARAVDAFVERTTVGARRSGRQLAELGMISVTTQQWFDWTAYEAAARDLYVTIWRQEFVPSVLTYVFYHPRDIGLVARSYLLSLPSPEIDIQQHLVTNEFDARDTYRPFGLAAAATVAIVAFVSGGALGSPAVAVVTTLALVGSAVLVPLVFYAGGLVVLAETFVVTAWAAYVVGAAAVWHVCRRALIPSRDRREAAQA